MQPPCVSWLSFALKARTSLKNLTDKDEDAYVERRKRRKCQVERVARDSRRKIIDAADENELLPLYRERLSGILREAVWRRLKGSEDEEM